MKFGKKFTLGFLPTLLCLVAMLVSACGNTAPPPNPVQAAAPKSQQHVKFAFQGGNGEGDISTFDPALDSDAPSAQAIQLVFTGMVQLNDTLQIQPQLAKSWDINNGGLSWVFHLKTGLKFSDGKTLDANDVAYSINRALSKDVNNLSGGLAATYLGLIKDSADFTAGKIPTLIGDSIKVIDPNTLELDLDHSTGYFLQALAYPTSWVVEKSVIDQWKDKWTDHLADNGGQGGDGPFIVKSYDHNTGIKFVPNPNYYNAQPQLQEVDYAFYKTSTTAFSAYQAGQVDQSAIPAAQIPVQKPKLGKQYHQYPLLDINYLALNYLYKPFDNIKIRQALELAIDKDLLNTSILNGIDIPTCHIVPQGMPGYDANLNCPQNAPTKGNPTLAKQLLDQGLQEEGLTAFPAGIKLTYYSNSPTVEKLMTTVRQMWSTNLGIDIGTNVIDFGAELTATSQTACTASDPSTCLNKGLAMWYIGWIADYPDPQDWTTLQFDKGAGYNQSNYGQNISTNAADQAKAQQELEAADIAAPGAARFAMYNTPEQQLVSDVAWLSLDQASGVYVQRTWIIGISDNAQAITNPDDWAHIYIAVH